MTSLDGNHLIEYTEEGFECLILPISWLPKFENIKQVEIMGDLLGIGHTGLYIYYAKIDGTPTYCKWKEAHEEAISPAMLRMHALWMDGAHRIIIISHFAQSLSEFNTPELEEFLKKRIADVLPEYQRLITKLVPE